MKHLLSLSLLGLCAVSFGDVDFASDGSPFSLATEWTYGTGALSSDFNFHPDGGNPNGYWSMTMNVKTGSYDIVGGMSNVWSFDPSAGNYVTSIDYTTDFMQHVASRSPGLLIYQDGKLFYGSIDNSDPALRQWIHLEYAGMQDVNFVELLPGLGGVDDLSHPNFGPDGANMSFYVGWGGLSFGNIETSSETVAWDNIDVHLHTVPEPASMATIVLGLCGFAARRRRKNSAA